MGSKFSYIKYPFFGTYTIPTIDISFNKISASNSKNYNSKDIKLKNSENYLEHLIALENLKNRFKFKITAQSTQELIMLQKRCQWGVDITGAMHNLSRLEEFPLVCLKPIKITNNKYIWFNTITKPLISPLSIKNIADDLYYYFYSFLYIDNVWELYNIHPSFTGNKTAWV